MEQRRIEGKSHWYHETQCSTRPQEVLPLVPEAANVNDYFLLDLVIDDDALLPFQSWLSPARQFAYSLFPAHLSLNGLHTFSAYERMSTALTVAQVYGVQRLCNHYAARLTPLPGPDSSRESNHRLAQITQYARQLASSPAVIDARARQHLDDVGLTACDIVVMNQIIGFIGFQARAVALFQAWLDLPVRRIPGLDMQQFASAQTFLASDGQWFPAHEHYVIRHTSEAQQTRLSQLQPELHALAPVLIHEPTLLTLLGSLMSSTLSTGTKPDALTLVALLTARINGSIACFNELAADAPQRHELVSLLRQGEAGIVQWEKQHSVERPLIQAIQLLTRAPDRFSAAQFTPLLEQGIPLSEVINLLGWCGLCGWLNRLKIALGEVR
ncbi:TPA: CMD domain-containing protein [Citrobacter freundii]